MLDYALWNPLGFERSNLALSGLGLLNVVWNDGNTGNPKPGVKDAEIVLAEVITLDFVPPSTPCRINTVEH
jgi:hypothetical protein